MKTAPTQSMIEVEVSEVHYLAVCCADRKTDIGRHNDCEC